MTHLTPQQQKVYDLLLLGLSTKEIAKQLKIAENTAKVHIQKVLKKANVKKRMMLLLNRPFG